MNFSWTLETDENEWWSFNVVGGVSARARRTMAGATAVPIDEAKNVRRAIRITENVPGTAYSLLIQPRRTIGLIVRPHRTFADR